MGKAKAERRLADTKAMAKASSIRSSARKLNLVAASIRGKKADAAMTQLTFEKRRVAEEVKKVLQSAIANAENNHNLDIDKLYVDEAWVGRAFVMKRMHPRGRGRSAGIEKPFSNLTIIVREHSAEDQAAAKAEKAANRSKSKSKPAATGAAAAGA
jgi:large subunit ribosomal protein L22